MVTAEETGIEGFEGQKVAGRKVRTYRLANNTGIECILMNLGPTLLSLRVPDAEGNVDDVLLGYPALDGYVNDASYQGRVAVGRWANRISGAHYFDNDIHDVIELIPNDGIHTLHGGSKGWSKKTWKVEGYGSPEEGAFVEFSLQSKNGDQGFRGIVNARVIVTLTQDNELKFEYLATTPFGETPVNLAFHGYFNLDGIRFGSSVLNHNLRTNTDRHLTVDGDLIPDGDILSVDGTRFDFKEMKKIGTTSSFGQTGYDNCLVFPTGVEGKVEVYSPETGRVMTMTTDQPAVQLYTGFFLKDPFQQFGGMCLEAQQLVNSLNMSQWWEEFGNPFIKPRVPYKQTTTYKFDVR